MGRAGTRAGLLEGARARLGPGVALQAAPPAGVLVNEAGFTETTGFTEKYLISSDIPSGPNLSIIETSIFFHKK